MKIKIDEVRELCENILIKHGFPESVVKIIVDDYIEGELEGKLTHGLLAFPSLLESYSAPKEKWTIEKESNSSIFINGKGNLGTLVCKQAINIICKKAKNEGVGLATINNIFTFLRPATITRMIAEKDMIGIVAHNGGREMVAPYGGIDPVLATNPIGVGIPTTEEPIIFDMATSKRAWAEVSISKIFEKLLPEQTFLDKDGNFTNDPSKAYSVVPFGGYKGYALGLLVEVLTGSLVSMPMGIRGSRGEADFRRFLRGSIIIVIDPSFFTNLNEFKKRNSDLVNQIKSTRKSKGVNEILIPGERSRIKKEENLQKGYIEVKNGIIEKIKKLAE